MNKEELLRTLVALLLDKHEMVQDGHVVISGIDVIHTDNLKLVVNRAADRDEYLLSVRPA